MSLNSQSLNYPPQPDNPSDAERYFLIKYALDQEGRGEDFNYIVKLMSPPPDITNYARNGEFKGVKVGIIGGGLAGLSAAFELKKLGFDITVLEALEDRVGGRVYTHYFDNQRTLYGEFGPVRIPASHETVWHYIKLFNIHTEPFISVNNNTYIYLRGARGRNDPNGLNVMRNIYPKYKLNSWERNVNWHKLFYTGIDRHLLYATPQERAEILQVKSSYNKKNLFWGEMSNLKMMELAGLSQEAINLVASFMPLLYGNLNNSFIDYIQQDYPAALSYLYSIPAGMEKLPYAFYNALVQPNTSKAYNEIDPTALGRVCWKSGALVKGIQYNKQNTKVKLKYIYSKCDDKKEEDFDYVICAIPFSSLRNVEIQPLFSYIKMRAIREVNYATAQKSILLCNQRFWERDGIVGGASFTDLPLSTIWYPSDHGKYISYLNERQNNYKSLPWNTPGVLTASYNFNLDAIRLSNLPEEIRLEDIKRQIEAVHGLPHRYLDNIVTGFKTVNWDEEPTFRGSLSFFAPQQKRLFSYGMSTPEYCGRIFFAGEHISAVHRWMQGALQTGKQAANDLAVSCKRYRHY